MFASLALGFLTVYLLNGAFIGAMELRVRDFERPRLAFMAWVFMWPVLLSWESQEDCDE